MQREYMKSMKKIFFGLFFTITSLQASDKKSNPPVTVSRLDNGDSLVMVHYSKMAEPQQQDKIPKKAAPKDKFHSDDNSHIPYASGK